MTIMFARLAAATLSLVVVACGTGAWAQQPQPAPPKPAAAQPAIRSLQPVPAPQPAAIAQPGAASQPVAPAKPAVGGTPKQKDRSSPLGNLGGNSKEPIKIDADRLDVFDKEQRAVFTGNVIAVQGETTIRCTIMTVFYEQQKGQGAAPKPATPSQGDSAIKKIDCTGPVTVVSKDQVATGDNATFDRAGNKVIMTGNVALSQCQNVTRGEKLVYDLNTGIANVDSAVGGRVKALFVPGGGNSDQPKGCEQPGSPSPAQPTPPVPKQRAQTN